MEKISLNIKTPLLSHMAGINKAVNELKELQKEMKTDPLYSLIKKTIGVK